jgi:hypothetical protein
MKTENKSALVHKYALSFMQQIFFSKKPRLYGVLRACDKKWLPAKLEEM